MNKIFRTLYEVIRNYDSRVWEEYYEFFRLFRISQELKPPKIRVEMKCVISFRKKILEPTFTHSPMKFNVEFGRNTKKILLTHNKPEGLRPQNWPSFVFQFFRKMSTDFDARSVLKFRRNTEKILDTPSITRDVEICYFHFFLFEEFTVPEARSGVLGIITVFFSNYIPKIVHRNLSHFSKKLKIFSSTFEAWDPGGGLGNHFSVFTELHGWKNIVK